jgi:hypothetical protein
VIAWSVETTVPDFEQVKAKGLRDAIQFASTVALAWMIDNRLEKRFVGTMDRELRWQPRSSKWQLARRKIIKKRTFDHNFRGTTYKTVRRNAAIVTRVRRDGTFLARIRMDGLGIQYGRRRRGNIDMKAELASISREEQAEVASMIGDEIAFYLEGNEEARYKKKRKKLPKG